MAGEWYYAQGGKQLGPVSGARLKELADAGQVHADDLVWRKGSPQWVPASSVKGLFPGSQVPPTLPGGGRQPAGGPSVAPPRQIGFPLVAMGIGALVMVVLFVPLIALIVLFGNWRGPSPRVPRNDEQTQVSSQTAPQPVPTADTRPVQQGDQPRNGQDTPLPNTYDLVGTWSSMRTLSNVAGALGSVNVSQRLTLGRDGKFELVQRFQPVLPGDPYPTWDLSLKGRYAYADEVLTISPEQGSKTLGGITSPAEAALLASGKWEIRWKNPKVFTGVDNSRTEILWTR